MTNYSAVRGRSRRPGLIDELAQATWTPLQISGLQEWLDASAISGLSDDDFVAQWDDTSGNGNHATQGTEANRPTYKTNRLNGRPAVYFPSAKSMVTSYSLSNPYTLFLVYVRRAEGNRVIQGALNWLIGPYSGTHAFYNGGWVGSGVAVAVDQAVYTTVTSSSGASAMRQNGVAKGSAGSDGLPSTLYIGYGGAYASEQAIADTLELLVYNSVLSAGNIALVEAYLAAKYGF